jgi:hypothetical protein
MSITVQYAAASATPASGATTTVQNIIDSVSQDIRKLLSSTVGNSDATILIDYVNRVQLELLRRSKWRWLLSTTQSFTTTSGVANYYLGTGAAPVGSTSVSLNLADLFAIQENSVVDRTNDTRLACFNDKPVNNVLDNAATNLGHPTLYRNDLADGPYTLNLYQTPNGVFTIEFRYHKTRNQLTSAGQILQIPDDYKDIVVAGVNRLACFYLKLPDEAATWNALYRESIADMLRDKNAFNREADFMRPDPASMTTATGQISISL